MIGKSRVNLFIFFILACGFATTGHASFYRVDISATIREVGPPNGGDISPAAQAILDEFGFIAGATISTTYLLDRDAPVNVVTDFGITHYSYDALVSGTLTIPTGNSAFDLQLPSAYSLTPSQELSTTARVGISARTTLEGSAGEILLNTAAQLFDEEGLALTSTELDPTVFLDLSMWESFDANERTGLFLSFSIPDSQSISVAAEYTSISVRAVPLPGAAWLLMSSILLGTALARKR